jgi:hypothetical protein
MMTGRTYRPCQPKPIWGTPKPSPATASARPATTRPSANATCRRLPRHVASPSTSTAAATQARSRTNGGTTSVEPNTAIIP